MEPEEEALSASCVDDSGVPHSSRVSAASHVDDDTALGRAELVLLLRRVGPALRSYPTFRLAPRVSHGIRPPGNMTMKNL